VRKFLLNEYTIKKEKFDIDIAISEYIIFYNNSFNGVTKRVPNKIKVITDLEKIKEINLNIIKSVSRKLRFEPNAFKNDYLLLNNNIKINKNEIKINEKIKKIIILFFVDLLIIIVNIKILN